MLSVGLWFCVCTSVRKWNWARMRVREGRVFDPEAGSGRIENGEGGVEVVEERGEMKENVEGLQRPMLWIRALVKVWKVSIDRKKAFGLSKWE
jgi:hypothetical protein